MLVEKLGPETHADWDAFVDGHLESNAYHLRAWATAAERAYGLEVPFLLARERAGQPVRGVLPLFVVRNALTRYATTGIFGAYGVLLADSEPARVALVAEAQQITRQLDLRYLLHKSLGSETPLPEFRTADARCVTAVLPLAPDSDAQWRAFRPEIRNRIRKAQRLGLDARRGADQLLAFYRVLAVNMHRKGTPIYGLPFLRELVGALGDRGEVVTLWHDGVCISGALVVIHRDVATVPFVSSLPSAFPLSPNNLLYWEILKLAHARSARWLDFGRSFEGSSNLTFKLRWGAQTVPQPWLVYSTNGARPLTDASDPTVRGLVHLWQRLPLRLANTLGPLLCGRLLV